MAIRWRLRAAATSAAIAFAGAGLIGLAPMASAATPAKPYDFNGDGFTDIALGSPYGRVGTVKHAGFVTVVYGTATGLNTTKKKVISQNSTGIPGAAETEDLFGYALTSADFDSDGFADLAVGTPGEDTTKGSNAGLDTIIWGSSSGLGSDAVAGSEPDVAAAGHRYGAAMTAGDITGDGLPEFIVGAPGTPAIYPFVFTPVTSSGRTHGTVLRENFTRSTWTSAAAVTAGVDSIFFGIGDVNGDKTADLAVGWRDSDAAALVDQTGFSLNLSGNNPPSQSAFFIKGGIAALAIGDFNKDTFGDVAVGEQGDATVVGGDVRVFSGSATGITETNTHTFGQTGNFPAASEKGDRFGSALAAGDANGDGFADLAIGVPYEDIGTLADAGMGAMLYGSATGLGHGQTFTQNTAGVPGTSEAGDHMGWAVSLLDHNRDGKADLTIGVPNENGTEGYLEVLKGRAPVITGTGTIAFGTFVLGVTSRTGLIGLRIGKR